MNDVGERIYNLLLACGIADEKIIFSAHHGHMGLNGLIHEIFWMLEEIYGEDEE